MRVSRPTSSSGRTDRSACGSRRTDRGGAGRRARLIRQHLTSETGDEIVFLNLSELDGTDRMTRTEIFDESDLVATIARLDEWYEATGAPRIESCVLGAYRSLNRRDWPASRTISTPSSPWSTTGGSASHRATMAPSLSFAELQMLVAQVPDVVAYPTRIESRGDVALITTHRDRDHGRRRRHELGLPDRGHARGRGAVASA